MNPGDAVFGRSILANGDPEEDAMQALGGVLYVSIYFDAYILLSIYC